MRDVGDGELRAAPDTVGTSRETPLHPGALRRRRPPAAAEPPQDELPASPTPPASSRRPRAAAAGRTLSYSSLARLRAVRLPLLPRARARGCRPTSRRRPSRRRSSRRSPGDGCRSTARARLARARAARGARPARAAPLPAPEHAAARSPQRHEIELTRRRDRRPAALVQAAFATRLRTARGRGRRRATASTGSRSRCTTAGRSSTASSTCSPGSRPARRSSSTTRPTVVAPTPISRPPSSATTASSGASTRSPRCATAPRASRSSTCYLERPAEPVVAHYDAADAPAAGGASCATRRRRCWPATSGRRTGRGATCARRARAGRRCASYPPELTASAGSASGSDVRLLVAAQSDAGALRPRTALSSAPKQERARAQPQPEQQDDHRPERAVGGAVVARSSRRRRRTRPTRGSRRTTPTIAPGVRIQRTCAASTSGA